MKKKNASAVPSLFDAPPEPVSVPVVVVVSAPVVAPPVAVVPPVVTPAEDEPMPATALVFLDDSVARRLAVAWKTCKGDERTWLETAGFPAHHQEAYRQSKALRANGVCRAGGVTDPLAIQYINALIAKQLPSGKKDKR